MKRLGEGLLGRLSYARVVGALAIMLIALGGGYSLAFSGSGKLQKGNKVGFTANVDEPIRTIGGIGPLLGNCAPAGNMSIRLGNSIAGKHLVTFTDRFDETDSTFVAPSTTGIPISTVGELEEIGPGTAGVLRVHVLPTLGSKRPQAKLTVGVVNTGNCSTSQVSVIDLTTEG
jgi:hypothetical protein